MKKKLILILCVTLTCVSLIGCSQSSTNNSTETAVSASSTTLEKEVTVGDIKEELALSGSIASTKSTSVTGQNSVVQTIYVSSNEEVLKGEDIILLENGNVIEAPFDGKISKISVSEGETITTSTTVFNILDSTSYKIETSVDETNVSKLSVGQTVDVKVTAIDKELTGTVTSIDGEASSTGNSTTYGVTISLSGDFEGVFSGMSAEVSIILKESTNTLLVPIESVKKSKGQYTVSVKDGDTTKDVTVEVGLQDSTYAEITSGLSEGDVVVYTQAAKTTSSSGTSANKGTQSGTGMQSSDSMSQGKGQMQGQAPDMSKGQSTNK